MIPPKIRTRVAELGLTVDAELTGNGTQITFWAPAGTTFSGTLDHSLMITAYSADSPAWADVEENLEWGLESCIFTDCGTCDETAEWDRDWKEVGA